MISGLEGSRTPRCPKYYFTPRLLNHWFRATHTHPHPLKLFVTLKILS
nr:MAG TPA: hypothetical protein [Caudoviricetes sp.]